jgi:hypothetical protein
MKSACCFKERERKKSKNQNKRKEKKKKTCRVLNKLPTKGTLKDERLCHHFMDLRITSIFNC